MNNEIQQKETKCIKEKQRRERETIPIHANNRETDIKIDRESEGRREREGCIAVLYLILVEVSVLLPHRC